MIDSIATINLMPMGVMRDLRLEVDDHYGRFYAMDNRLVLVLEVMKDVEVKIVSYPEATYKIDIIVIDVPPHYGMLLSRQWIGLVGGSIQLDFSYATVPVNGKQIRIKREPRSPHIIECLKNQPMINICDTEVGNFTIQITKSKLQNNCQIIDHTMKHHADIWKFFDGACS